VTAIFTIGALFLYGVVTIAHLLPALAGGHLARLATPTAALGLLCHGLALVADLYTLSEPPGLSQALSVLAFGVVISSLWAMRGERLRVVGLLLQPLALVMLSLAQMVPSHRVVALSVGDASIWLPLHVGLVFAGILGFLVSSAAGAVYLWTRNRLKTKRLSGIGRLPPLELLDRVQFRSMLFGFVFLTLGIATGGAWAALAFDASWVADWKVWFTFLIWAWYGAGLHLRIVLGWRGRWTALFSLFGVCAVIFSLVGINFLTSSWHGYGG